MLMDIEPVHFKARRPEDLLTSKAEFWKRGWQVTGQLPCNKSRHVKRNSSVFGFPFMRIVERGDHLTAVLILIVSS